MKKKIAALLAGALCLSALTACGGGNDAQTAEGGASDDKTIVVGASPTPHAEILNAAKDVLAEAGWTLEVVEFTDYVQPNTALVDGDLDANYFQHIPYLNNFNEENNADLVSAIEMHYEPFGIYPGKTATLEELADGATIAVPNDGSNETRALLLLQDAGLISGVYPATAEVDDSKVGWFVVPEEGGKTFANAWGVAIAANSDNPDMAFEIGRASCRERV